VKPKEEVVKIIKDRLTDQELKKSIVYWDHTVKEKGYSFIIGSRTVEMPFNGTIAFADLKPNANLGHPFKCFLIDAARKNVQVIDALYPPDGRPHNFHVILSHGKMK